MTLVRSRMRRPSSNGIMWGRRDWNGASDPPTLHARHAAAYRSAPASRSLTAGGLRVPPLAGQHHADGVDLAVADQLLTDDVDVVEAALTDREDGGIADAARLEAAELRPFQYRRRVDGGRGDDVGQRHAHAQK